MPNPGPVLLGTQERQHSVTTEKKCQALKQVLTQVTACWWLHCYSLATTIPHMLPTGPNRYQLAESRGRGIYMSTHNALSHVEDRQAFQNVFPQTPPHAELSPTAREPGRTQTDRKMQESGRARKPWVKYETRNTFSCRWFTRQWAHSVGLAPWKVNTQMEQKVWK